MTGDICATTSLQNLVTEIIKSNNNYIDELKSICYDLVVFVSAKNNLTAHDFMQINFDANNCSFQILSVCVGQTLSNMTGPRLRNLACEKSLYLSPRVIQNKQKLINEI